MKNFKVEVSKWLDKYTLIKKSFSEASLREELHKEGFSILSIVEMNDVEVSGNKYYFEILQNGETKLWTISSTDIFKSYVKIKYELKYNLQYIYPSKECSLEEKQTILHDLEEQYAMYQDLNKKEIQKEKNEELSKLKTVQEESIDTFQMKKEIDETHKIIDKVLSKLKTLIDVQDSKYLDYDKKLVLKEIYQAIIRLKTSTNLIKLRQVGEIGLIKIGEIELRVVEDTKNQKMKELLSETNKLLKQVGSKKVFIEKEKDLNYLFNQFLTNVKKFFEESKTPRKKIEIDKKTSSYLKTKLLLQKYKNKLSRIDAELFQNMFYFLIPSQENQEKKQNLLLRKKVIKQNILLLEGRLKGEIFSYVKIMRGYNQFVDALLDILNFFQKSFLVIMFVYSFFFSLLFLFSNAWIGTFHLNYNGLFYFLLINFAFILIHFVRGLWSFIFNIVIFVFFFIFWVINF